MSVVSTGIRSLMRREILRYVRMPQSTFLPPLVTNALFFVVFGVIIGGRIDSYGQFSYILFILPGLVVLGVVSQGFQNASFTIFHGRWEDYIEEIQTAPLSYGEMVVAYVLTSALRGIIVGTFIGIIGAVFTLLDPETAVVGVAHPLYVVAFVLVISVLFSALGVVGGLWATTFDDLAVMNQFIIQPLVFVGAVFYPLSILAQPWQTVSLINPMVYMVDGVRYGFLGISEIGPDLSLAVLTVAAVVAVAVDAWLFRHGYGLTE
ncbi:ABC transporter [Halobacteriales archaeon QS_8_65_32]|nr:MAG: ABC transporter [Halobacteriales archaeon QS_8_65_32]